LQSPLSNWKLFFFGEGVVTIMCIVCSIKSSFKDGHRFDEICLNLRSDACYPSFSLHQKIQKKKYWLVVIGNVSEH
jgi:hypothetical protein